MQRELPCPRASQSATGAADAAPVAYLGPDRGRSGGAPVSLCLPAHRATPQPSNVVPTPVDGLCTRPWAEVCGLCQLPGCRVASVGACSLCRLQRHCRGGGPLWIGPLRQALWSWTMRATLLRRLRCALRRAFGIIPTTNKTDHSLLLDSLLFHTPPLCTVQYVPRGLFFLV